ncbi:MAG TPA: ComEC/Rec2 family competence protein, partial [Ignavibacteria bacterium]
VAHIIAVSGLNVAYILIIIWAVLMFIPVKQNYKIFISIILLVFYMNLTGNTPSIIRATIMASVFLLAQVFERKTNSYNIISFAALIILLIDPRQLFDAGFILSFSAILSIVVLYPKIDEWLKGFKWYAELNTEKMTGKTIKFILGLFFGTLAAQIGTLPITAIMFKKISIVSLAANLFAIPLSNITLAIGFIVIIVSLFSSWLASVFASFNIVLMFLQLKAIEFCAKLDYAYFETYFVDAVFLLVYFTIITILFTASKRNIIPRAIIVFAISLNFIIYSSLAEQTDKVKLTYMDAGNSNSTLIKLPQGTYILINAGGSTDKYFSAERNIIPYLRREGVGSIDLLFINSLNLNEFKNLLYFVKHFDVNRIIMPAYYKPLFEIQSVNGKFKDVKIDFIVEPIIINKQGNFRLYVYYNSELKGETMMTEFVYGEQSFIFSDSYNALDDYISTAYLPHENALMVLKAAGSGSFDYNSADFIARAEPEFIVISSSDKGRKKAESDLFKSALEESGYTVFKTSEEGAIIFETDGYVTNRVMWR